MKFYNKFNLWLKLIIVLLGCMCVQFSGFAQKMSVESFEFREKDLDANRDKTTEYDQNGEKCALIKIQTTERNFQFNTGSLGVVKVVSQNSSHPGEIWLYVPSGVKSLSIQHPQLGSINDFDLGMTLKKGKTYRLKLTSDQINTQVIDYEHSQNIEIKVVPSNAELFINGMRQQLNSNGICDIPLAFGTHNYRVIAKDYHHEDGQFKINDNSKKHFLNIKLKPAHGLLTIIGGNELTSGEVYIDNNLLGILPIENKPVGSGTHKLKIVKKLYKPYEFTFSISDNEKKEIAPKLIPDYANIDLSVPRDKEAEIYDNGSYLGKGKWSGRLESGKHVIEARHAHHTSSQKEIQIINGNDMVVHLDAPVPKYGSLSVNSNPNNADVWLDGTRIGTTPYYSNKIIEGEHSLELRKTGCKSEVKTIRVSSNFATSENITLSQFGKFKISSTPEAFLSIDGKYEGKTPYHFNRMSGKYKIILAKPGYRTYNKTLTVDATTKDMHIKLIRDYVRSNEFYMQIGYYNYGKHGFNAGMGCYIHNINLEANYFMGFSTSEEVYWYDKSPGHYINSALYSPWGTNVKVGYGFRGGSRFRITPQMGWQFLKLKTSNSYDNGFGAYASSALGALRIHYVLAGCLGVYVSPEYRYAFKKSDGFEALSSVSKEIKSYGQGFGGSVGLTLFF